MLLHKTLLLTFAALGAFTSIGALAASFPDGEQLLAPMPPGYKVGFQVSRNGMNMQEWVPDTQTVENWSDMITIQIFPGKKDFDTGPFLNGIGQQWLAACKESKPNNINTGSANGYKVSMLLMNCPMNSQTGKPETTLFRAIKGNDSFYSVQKSFRSNPSPEQLQQWARYLATVNACDTRSTDHPCKLPESKSP